MYLVPIEIVFDPDSGAENRGPKYFVWDADLAPVGITANFSVMDYGFVPSGLLYSNNITQLEHDGLILNADVYAFPDNLDQPVADPTIDVFFEAIHIPTNWLTPSTTYRELLRQVAGMFLFSQRYSGIAAAHTNQPHSLFDNATLDTRLRQMTTQEQAWFQETVDWFANHFNIAIPPLNDNNRLRQMVRQAGDFWAGQPFFMGGAEF